MPNAVETLRADATLHVDIHFPATPADDHDGGGDVPLHATVLDLASAPPIVPPSHPAEPHTFHPHHHHTTVTKKMPLPSPKTLTTPMHQSASLQSLSKELLPPRHRKKYPYPAFRSTCFTDKALLPVPYNTKLRSSVGTMAESRRIWTTAGPQIGCERRLDDLKHTGLYVPSLDRVYDTTVQTMSYRVHMSMWGSSLWDTSQRFQEAPRTAPTVGPGSYNPSPSSWGKEPSYARPAPIIPFNPHRGSPTSSKAPPTSSNHAPTAPLASLDSWKLCSTKTVSGRPAFDKAPRKTWVDWESTKADRMRAVSTPNLALPNFLSGARIGEPRSPPKRSTGLH
ncbi:hypothetical protein H310_03996 [Aphanomyces invadans]|uniref:Uncharacterized protein n=1 Tax=Aphanomyces invadans TaxID=157072 RepID=A0A024UH20_9STRA|nr:hypothetical protein H310_03996 [Aphanomyces invadans]ETW04888.1 hypothetical protein H310_03996 [Aphanomyces invadans]|eukprot:XP_008866326.1 hypothetical protein H310_03996 [Aphanomyces invadans]